MYHLKPRISVIGNSKKFIEVLQRKFPQPLNVLSWREIDFVKRESADIIYVVGYDYASYQMDYSTYHNSNIKSPLNLIKSLSNEKTVIYYVDTEHSSKNYTYSRYRYAKYQLGLALFNQFGDRLRVLTIPTIVDDEGTPQVRGNLFEKIVFKFAIKAGVVGVIKLREVQRCIIEDEFKQLQYTELSGKLLKIRRISLVDRFMRVICG